MLGCSHRIWLKDGTFVQLSKSVERDFAEMLEEKLGSEAATAFLEIVEDARLEADCEFFGDY